MNGFLAFFVILYLLVNLGFGFIAGIGIKTLKEFAIGDKKFSNITLTATIVATWLSGSWISIHISEVYDKGVLSMLANSGAEFCLLFTAFIIGPRVKDFLGCLSVAEVMGKLFGDKIRFITAIGSVLMSLAYITIQLKILSSIFKHTFGADSNNFMLLISAFVVIAYSAVGGIKAVTRTDLIQFITFGIAIPFLVAYLLVVNGNGVKDTLQNDNMFNIKGLFDHSIEVILPYLFLFVYNCIPGLSPIAFQRILMARTIEQIKTCFTWAGVVGIIMNIFVAMIAVVMYSKNKEIAINDSNVLFYLIKNYFALLLQLIFIIAVIAMIMSTADSWLNASSVMIAHDIMPLLGFKNKGLSTARIAVIAVGLVATYMSLFEAKFLQITILGANFYMPIVTVPLLLAIFGFVPRRQVVAKSMLVGAITVILWKIYVQPTTGIDSVVPGMFMHLIAIFTFHMIGNRKGGWADDSFIYLLLSGKVKVSNSKKIVS